MLAHFIPLFFDRLIKFKTVARKIHLLAFVFLLIVKLMRQRYKLEIEKSDFNNKTFTKLERKEKRYQDFVDIYLATRNRRKKKCFFWFRIEYLLNI